MKKITILLLIGASLNTAMIHTMGPGAGAAPAGAGGPAQQQHRRIVPLKVKAARAAARALHDGQIDIAGFGRSSPIEKANILRQFYLVYGEDAPDAFVDNAREVSPQEKLFRGPTRRRQYLKKMYKFSVQELLDAGKIPAIISSGTVNFPINRLNLSSVSYIHRLDGLENIPGIDGLTMLQINYNPIENIERGAFQGLGNLRFIYLSNNRIKTIASGAFQGLRNLEELFLSRNQIQTIRPEMFDMVSDLKKLNLGNNPISPEDKQRLKDGLLRRFPNMKLIF